MQAVALDWVASSQGDGVDAYLAQHRGDGNISELKTYFTSVIDWIGSEFTRLPDKEMRGLEWGRPYEAHHSMAYNAVIVDGEVSRLLGDTAVQKRRAIYEYVLGGGTDPRLLEIRVFDERVIAARYAQ